jgi:3-phosphoshikimate 1-carboxyvinyltransferase
MLGSIGRGRSLLAGMPGGRDVLSTERVLRRLGVSVGRDRNEVVVEGKGPESLLPSRAPLDCGNSGTTMRLMAGLLAGAGVSAVLTGDASLRRRPMDRIAEPLRAMGARVETAEGGRPPIRIDAGPVRAVTYRSPVASAQVKSCLLLAGLGARGRTCVIEPSPTRDHTERLLRAMGAEVVLGGDGRACVDGPARLTSIRGRVPGDASSAAYWLVAATLAPGSALTLPGVGMNPGRRVLLDLLLNWGADIQVTAREDSLGEPVADLHVSGLATPLSGGRIDPARVPGLIDELPLLGLVAPLTREGVEVTGAAELRVKESDRIESTCAAVRALGGEVQEYPDGFAVRGGTGLRGGEVDTAGDHRIALAVAAVSVAAAGPINVDGADAAEVSYPRFTETLCGVRS